MTLSIESLNDLEIESPGPGSARHETTAIVRYHRYGSIFNVLSNEHVSETKIWCYCQSRWSGRLKHP